MRKIFLALFIGSAFANSTFAFVAPPQPPKVGKSGMVVTEQHLASEVGLDVLKAGGNAVDAAVAVGYALAVVNPCCGNLGGGGFMTIHLANGKNTFINFREKAPLSATKNLFQDKQGNIIPGLSTKSYLAVGVPGTVMGLERALSKYGTMKRQQLMAPAIKFAENGFVLQQADANILNSQTKEFAQPNVATIFLKNSQNPYQAGDLLVQKDLANTLKLIADKGSQAFYNGLIADEIVKASSENQGILTKKDFAQFSVEETQPVECNYRGYKIISSPPPGSGAVLCEMLDVLQGYPLKELGFRTPASMQRMLSTMLYAYADRNNYLGDPNFIKIPLKRLLSQDYAAKIRSEIPENQATAAEKVYRNVQNIPEGTHTTQYSIVDRYGNAVSVTYTINNFFGSGKIAGNTGFFLNDEMDDFTSKPGTPNSFGLVQGANNAIAPGKRPLSSMSPTVITRNGKVFMVTGSPGGPTIITTVLQIITNVLDYNLDIQTAVDASRFHYQGLPDLVQTETGALSPPTIQRLSQMGYKFKAVKMPWGDAESILVDPKTGLMYGATDWRRPAGSAVGYSDK